MNIAVLGATGRTGRLVVAELLRRGHHVAVLARDPAALGAVADQVAVVQGDSRDPDALGRLVPGADAVISALGPRRDEPDLHSTTARSLVPAMDAAGVTRFVGVSGAGIDLPGDEKSTSARLISRLIRLTGGEIVRDKPREHAVLAASDLEWTLARPPRLTEGPATGRVDHDAHRSVKGTRIARADLAAFLIDCVEQGRYLREAPFVAQAR